MSGSGCSAAFTLAQPPLSFQQVPTSLPLPGISSTKHTPQLLLFHRANNKESKMSQYTINDNNFSNNTNSFNVSNNYTFTDDRSQLLNWLSPLEPGLRHWDIQERRVNNVGEWLIKTQEFRRWCGLDGESESDKVAPVLFGYGGPGVGKTFIR